MKILHILLFTIILTIVDAQQPLYTNLAFEGAGIKGLAYSGVIRELEKAGMIDDITRVAGTSAGAITALMISLGYTSNEIYTIISDTEFQKFNDGEYLFIGGMNRMKNSYGWYQGDEFGKWLEGLIKAKTGDPEITFSGLAEGGYKDLYVTATCLNRQKLLIFSRESYPDMKVKDAVRISMSIPLYFEAVFIDSTGKVYKDQEPGLDVVVDGGIVANYPIFIFDSTYIDPTGQEVRIPDAGTIGVRIDTDEQIAYDSEGKELAPAPIENISEYIGAFYTMVIESLNRNTLIPVDWDRTISVSSVGIGPKIKKLSEEQKQALMTSGEEHTREFLKQHGLL